MDQKRKVPSPGPGYRWVHPTEMTKPGDIDQDGYEVVEGTRVGPDQVHTIRRPIPRPIAETGADFARAQSDFRAQYGLPDSGGHRA